LAGYDSSDNEEISEEERERLVNMSEDDWQEWIDILEGKDALRKKSSKTNDRGSGEESVEALPAPAEKRRRKTPIVEPGTGRAERKGSSTNAPLFANLASKTNSPSATSSPSKITPSPPTPVAIPTTGGRKKAAAPRRTRKTGEE
jgi:hypothetical protein